MRILPNSKNADLLYESKKKIDQAYNYTIEDEKVEKCYKLTCEFFANINIRYFEHFFSSIDIATSALKREKLDILFSKEIKCYYKLLDKVNNEIYEILKRMFVSFTYKDEDVSKLLDYYSKAEMMYIIFTKKLERNSHDIYMMLPHGKEELNI